MAISRRGKLVNRVVAHDPTKYEDPGRKGLYGSAGNTTNPLDIQRWKERKN